MLDKLHIKIVVRTIDKTNHKEAIKFCWAVAILKGQNRKYATKLYETIKEGKAKIYFYEDNSWDYKRLKK